MKKNAVKFFSLFLNHNHVICYEIKYQIMRTEGLKIQQQQQQQPHTTEMTMEIKIQVINSNCSIGNTIIFTEHSQ